MHTRQDNINYTFYLERQPISDNHAKESLKTAESLCKTPSWKVYRVKYAMKVCGLDYKGLGWGRQHPVFVAAHVTFDWAFVNYYFHRFLDSNPFGIS